MVTAIVLAAGKGSRMNSSTPKQYLSLAGKPVLYYSLEAFSKSNADNIVLVTGKGDEEYCQREIVERYKINKPACIVAGGEQRYDSVYCGLKAAAKADYVLIHDGARPLIDVETINHAIEKVKEVKACVVGMPVKDTIQLVNTCMEIETTPKREQVWMAQTPQCFSYELVLRSYQKAIQAKDATITDDAMVVHTYAKAPIVMMEGSYQNIKITTPEDIAVAEVLFKEREKKQGYLYI